MATLDRRGTPDGRVVLTYKDYCALPSDGKRYQILGGELDVTPAPSVFHQEVSARLLVVLRTHVASKRLGLVLAAPVDVVLDDHNVVQPDLVFVSSARMSIVGELSIVGAPDLAVEILSNSTAPKDRGAKATIYALHGVRWYWIVDPDARVVEEYAAGDQGFKLRSRVAGDQQFTPALLPGLAIALSDLFRP